MRITKMDQQTKLVFQYILTQDNTLPPPREYGQPRRGHPEPLLFDKVRTPEGLARLGLQEGSVDGLLFIVDREGNLYTVFPDEQGITYNERCYGLNVRRISDGKKRIVSYMRRKMKTTDLMGKPRAIGSPRGIVFSKFEPEIIRIARALGYIPTKLSEELFETPCTETLQHG